MVSNKKGHFETQDVKKQCERERGLKPWSFYDFILIVNFSITIMQGIREIKPEPKTNKHFDITFFSFKDLTISQNILTLAPV